MGAQGREEREVTGVGGENQDPPRFIYVGELDACPMCYSSWEGDPIKEEHRHLFGGITHFRRVIAVYSREQDRTVAWRCPDCGHEWGRDAKASICGREATS